MKDHSVPTLGNVTPQDIFKKTSERFSAMFVATKNMIF